MQALCPLRPPTLTAVCCGLQHGAGAWAAAVCKERGTFKGQSESCNIGECPRIGSPAFVQCPTWVCGVAQEQELFEKTKRVDGLTAEVRDLSSTVKKKAAVPHPVQQPKATTCETTAARVVHEDVQCDHCKTVPIVGSRYKLPNRNYDLCEKCITKLKNPEHVSRFEKIDQPREPEIVAQPESVASGGGAQPESVASGGGARPESVASGGGAQRESAGATGSGARPAGAGVGRGADDGPNAGVEPLGSGCGCKRVVACVPGGSGSSKVAKFSSLHLSDRSASETDDSDGLGSESETDTPQPGAGTPQPGGRTLVIEQGQFTLRRSALMMRQRQDGTWYYIDLYGVRGDSAMLVCVLNPTDPTRSISCVGSTKSRDFVRIPTEDRPTPQECEQDVARFISALRAQLVAFRRSSSTVRSRAMALFGRYEGAATRLVHWQETEVRAFFTRLAATGKTARADREVWLARMDAAIAAAAAMPAPSAKPQTVAAGL